MRPTDRARISSRDVSDEFDAFERRETFGETAAEEAGRADQDDAAGHACTSV